eukprot:15140972-Alexandrium_andersonii.AAC.1
MGRPSGVGGPDGRQAPVHRKERNLLCGSWQHLSPVWTCVFVWHQAGVGPPYDCGNGRQCQSR